MQYIHIHDHRTVIRQCTCKASNQVAGDLVLQEPQATLYHHVLQNRSWWDIDGLAFCCDNDDRALEGNAATQVDSTSDGEMVKLDNLGNAGNARLKAGDLLEVAAQLDERSRAEAVRVHNELAMRESVEV